MLQFYDRETIDLVGDAFLADNKTYVVVPDIHVPFHDPAFLSIVKKVAKIAKPDGFIQLGDALDFWQVSRFDKNPLRKQTLAEDGKIYHGILQEWAEIIPFGGVIHQLEGNHEDRLRRYIWANAKELAGLVQTVPQMIGLRDLGVRTVWHDLSNYKSCQIGDALIHHGHYYNMHVAMGNLTRYGKSLITGHTHRYQYVSNGERFSVTLGHGSNEYETAHQPTPTGWQQAMGLLHVIKGKTSLEPILVHDAYCIFRGRRIEA